MTKDFFNLRPLSWSAISSFAYDPEQWYSRYILNQKQPESPAMLFGKQFALSCEARKPLAPVKLLSEVEYKLDTVFNGIKLVGFIDTYEPHKILGEFKTGKECKSDGTDSWDQKRVDQHGQLDMYALQLYIQHKVVPDKLKFFLQWIPTTEDENFNLSFAYSPPKVYTFKTKRTMQDIIRFGVRINNTVEAMIKYANEHE